MPVRAVLDELERLGAARRTDDGHIEYVRPMFLGRSSTTDKLDLLGTDVADLITTIDHNVQHGVADPRFQRKVMYRDMPAAVLPEFRMLVAAHGMAVLQQLDVWLAAHRQGSGAENAPHEPKVRLGLGVYYFEEAQATDAAARQPHKQPRKRAS